MHADHPPRHVENTVYTDLPPLDLGAMLRVAWHGKILILLCFCATVFAGGFYAFKMTAPQFAATATLQVDAQTAHLGDVSQQWPMPATDIASLNTEITLLTTDRILQQVVAREGLIADPEFNRYLQPVSPLAPDTLRRQLRNLIAGTTDTPPDATAIANKTVANLRAALSVTRPRDTLLFHVTAHSRDADKAAQLANSAAAVYIATQISAKNKAADAAITELGTRVSALQATLIAQENAITDLIASAQIQDAAGLDDLSNAVLETDQAHATAMEALATYNTDGTTPREAAEAGQLRDEIAHISARGAQLRGQLAAQSAGLIRLQQLQREADTTRVLYRSFRARLQETQVQRGLEYPNSTLIAPAVTGQYVGPRKTLILLISGMLGLLLGLLAVGLQHMKQDGVLHPAMLQSQITHPVLTTLHHSWMTDRRHIFTRIEPSSTHALNGAMRKILGGVMLQKGGDIPKFLMVTSSTTGESKTALSLGIARSLSQRNCPVLLLQADVSGKTARHFIPKLKNAAWDASAIQHDPTIGCDVLHLCDLKHILDTGFADMLKSVGARYDHVVINAPPLGSGPEAQLLAARADTILFAVHWAKTPMPVVVSRLAALTDGASATLGVVITQAKARKMRHFQKVFAPRFSFVQAG